MGDGVKTVIEHHKSWLLDHPDRTEEWFESRIKDGFDVHHVDGNHYNNDPANLILIEGADHLRLHSGSLKAGIKNWRINQSEIRKLRPVKHVFPTKKQLAENRTWQTMRETTGEYLAWRKKEVGACP